MDHRTRAPVLGDTDTPLSFTLGEPRAREIDDLVEQRRGLGRAIEERSGRVAAHRGGRIEHLGKPAGVARCRVRRLIGAVAAHHRHNARVAPPAKSLLRPEVMHHQRGRDAGIGRDRPDRHPVHTVASEPLRRRVPYPGASARLTGT